MAVTVVPEIVGKWIRCIDDRDWRGRVVTTSQEPDGRIALHVQWGSANSLIGITYPDRVELDIPEG